MEIQSEMSESPENKPVPEGASASPGENRSISPFQRITRAIEIVLGSVFLVGAVLKAMDINLFAVQIKFYGVLASPFWITVAAIGVLWIETGFGFALLVGLRFRKLVLTGALSLLVVFTGLILYGWFFHGLKDCGCFGPVEMSPLVSVLKNIALALMVLAVWFGSPLVADRSIRRTYRVCAVIALLASSVSAYAFWHLEPPINNERPFAQFVFEEEGMPWDLGAGEYLVVMLSMSCEHCKSSIPALNEIAQKTGLPALVALCYEEKAGELETFREETEPLFPLYSLGNRVRLFFSLIGSEPPRLIYVKDGQQMLYWDMTIPAPNDLLAQLPADPGQ